MDTTCWHMNAMLGGANLLPVVILHPTANLHLGANCAYEHIVLILILTPKFFAIFTTYCMQTLGMFSNNSESDKLFFHS